jgi:hypothetical protein
VTGKRLLKRLVSVFLGMLGFFLFLHAVDADATTAAVGTQHSATANFPPIARQHSVPAKFLRN